MPASASGTIFSQIIEQRVPAALAGDATADFTLGVAPQSGAIISVTFIPDAAITGANTNSFTSSVVNKGQAGAGTTVAASKAFVSGTNATAFAGTDITVSGTPANLDVVQGDVIAWRRTLVGTGLATPAGLVRVRIGQS